jgi:glycosyltransferase involved in cell wall biosynthesis
VEDNIIFLGTRYDIPNLLNIMNIFVLPSLREGLPIVIIEALAAGCPVIATNVDGIPEIISNKKNGLLVSPKNVEELSSAIETLLTNSGLRNDCIEEGLVTVKSTFTIDKMVKDYNNLYQTCLNRIS